METTFDGLLNRRVTVEQPAKGFRVAIDTVFLAAAVPAVAGQRVLEFGSGVGAAMLVLAARVPEIAIDGIEIQPELAELCRRNIILNNMTDRIRVQVGDVMNATCSGYCHVMMNPPYHDEARHDVSADDSKRIANAGAADDITVWIARAAKALVAGGSMSIIHRADCEAMIVAAAARYFDVVEVLPLVPALGAPPKRIIVRAHKTGGEKLVRRCEPLVLHKDGGGFSDAAEDVLRHAKPLEFH